VTEYTPTDMSVMLTASILEAVPALLEQHHEYDQSHLEQYLTARYPEIPEAIRGSIVIAATAGARHAALMHGVCEKNAMSVDQLKRQYAAEAASSLSFWALGLRQPYRSVSVSGVQTNRPPRIPTPLVTPPVSYQTASPTVTAGSVVSASSVMAAIQLPVPISSDDAEFNVIYSESVRYPLLAGLLSPVSSAPLLGSEFGGTPVVSLGEVPTILEGDVVATSSSVSSSGQPRVIVTGEDRRLADDFVNTSRAQAADLCQTPPLSICVADDDDDLDADVVVCQLVSSAAATVAAPVALSSGVVSVAGATGVTVASADQPPVVTTTLSKTGAATVEVPPPSPCSSRLLALSAQPAVGKRKIPDVSYKSESLPERKKTSTSSSTTSRKRVREDATRHVTMTDEQYRRYQEFLKIKNKKY